MKQTATTRSSDIIAESHPGEPPRMIVILEKSYHSARSSRSGNAGDCPQLLPGNIYLRLSEARLESFRAMSVTAIIRILIAARVF